MPVPTEYKAFFTRLVEKSRKSEIHWASTGRPDAYRVTLGDISITIAQEGSKPFVRVRLLNDRGDPVADIKVDAGDDEWLGAVSLINSANRKVARIDETMSRAMAELAKEGPIGTPA